MLVFGIWAFRLRNFGLGDEPAAATDLALADALIHLLSAGAAELPEAGDSPDTRGVTGGARRCGDGRDEAARAPDDGDAAGEDGGILWDAVGALGRGVAGRWLDDDLLTKTDAPGSAGGAGRRAATAPRWGSGRARTFVPNISEYICSMSSQNISAAIACASGAICDFQNISDI